MVETALQNERNSRDGLGSHSSIPGGCHGGLDKEGAGESET